MESGSKRRARKNELKKLVLEAVKAAGVISVFLVAPNVIGAMAKLGIVETRRRREVIRRSCDRLTTQGLLEWREKKLRLTPKGERALRRLEASGYRVHKPKRWDGKWRVLIFDIPDHRGQLRARVRATLSAIGFIRLQNSVWIYPYDCEDAITLLKADFKVGKDILYLVVEALENDKRIRERFGV